MHLPLLIRDLAVILAVAGLMSLIFQKIRQPVVLGYIIAGMIVGPHAPPFQLVTDIPSIRTWAELGVIFLMFSLGLEFSFRKLARVGVSAGIAAGTEVLFFLPVGYACGKIFGWSTMDSIFLGAMLAISSTTIIIKALDELKLKTHRFAELIFGVLIVEDLFAILLLVGLSTVAISQTISAFALLVAALKLMLVVGGWFIVGYFVVPRLMRYVGKVGNNEMLTLISLGLCLGLVVFATHFQYSTALGAFIMGSILAETTLLQRIEERMESLRDLFGAIFFVSIGMLIDPLVLWEHKGVVAILCAVTILGKIISSSLGCLISGQTFRNSIQVGFGLAQIGEFSFIIASLGVSLQVTSDFLYPVAVAVSLVTTFTTPYLIRYSLPIADALERHLPRRLRGALNRYALRSEARRLSAGQKTGASLVILRWLLNGVTVSVIFVLSAEMALPYLQRTGFSEIAAALISWGLAAFLSAPFIWAMFSAFSRKTPIRAPVERELISAEVRANVGTDLRRGVIPVSGLFSKLLTIAWMGGLSAAFFPGRYVALITTVGILAFFGIFYRRLEIYYLWYEQKFLSTFKSTAQTTTERLEHLAPWDVHLVKLQVHPNSSLVRQSLSQASLRTRRGVNVVAIQRGYATIVAPRPDEVILPGDELMVLGTDEQVDRVRQDLDLPAALQKAFPETSHYEIRQVRISDTAALVGQSIRQSGIRERFQAMVVGLERQGERNISLDSDLILKAGDTLWVVGEKSKLDGLVSELFRD